MSTPTKPRIAAVNDFVVKFANVNEVRDRFEITHVLDTRELSRFIDYDLDYERGTIFFKEPVQSRDQKQLQKEAA